MVLRTLYELGQFDDIIQATDRVKPESSVGLVFANAADVWNDAAEYGCVGTPPCDYQGPWGAAKRSLYIALKHIQITDIDMLLDDDVQDPQLMAQYSTVYVVDPHMGTNTSIACAVGGSGWLTVGQRDCRLLVRSQCPEPALQSSARPAVAGIPGAKSRSDQAPQERFACGGSTGDRDAAGWPHRAGVWRRARDQRHRPQHDCARAIQRRRIRLLHTQGRQGPRVLLRLPAVSVQERSAWAVALRDSDATSPLLRTGPSHTSSPPCPAGRLICARAMDLTAASPTSFRRTLTSRRQL